MQTGKILTTAEVKEIIAKHFGVTADKIISSKYSFIVVTDEKEAEAK